jgi:predicted MFS family arabinose efflux permease
MASSTVEPAVPAQSPSTEYSTGYRAWLLIILLLVNALNLADRQGMAITAPAIKHDLALSDTQLGLLLGLGFAIFFTLLALPIARIAEHWSRTRIIAISVAVAGTMLSLCGIARNFWQFLLFRIGVGASDAGFGPPVASLLGDHYPASKRASANTIIWLGAPLGAVVGSVAGGWIAQEFGWRLWFFALGAPALVLAAVAFFTLREPLRGMSDQFATSGKPPGMMEVLRFLWAKRSFRHILIGAGLAAISMNALGQFFARFFVSTFHIGFAQAGGILGMMAGTAMTSGLLIGGFGMDRAGRRDRRWYVWGPAITLWISAPLFILGVSQTALSATIILLLIGHVSLFVFWSPTLALAMNMVGANMRASSAFVINVVLGLVGIGLGPTLIGIFSDFFAHRAFGLGDFGMQCPGGAAPPDAATNLARACDLASATGVRNAITVMSLLFLWAGLHYFLAAKHLDRDLDTHYAK